MAELRQGAGGNRLEIAGDPPRPIDDVVEQEMPLYERIAGVSVNWIGPHPYRWKSSSRFGVLGIRAPLVVLRLLMSLSAAR